MKRNRPVFLYEIQQARRDLAWGICVTVASMVLGVVWFLAGVPA